MLLRGNIKSKLVFRVNKDSSESVIISMSYKILSKPGAAPASLLLVGANKLPLPVQSMFKLRLLFGEPRWLDAGASFTSVVYIASTDATAEALERVFCAGASAQSLWND